MGQGVFFRVCPAAFSSVGAPSAAVEIVQGYGTLYWLHLLDFQRYVAIFVTGETPSEVAFVQGARPFGSYLPPRAHLLEKTRNLHCSERYLA